MTDKHSDILRTKTDIPEHTEPEPKNIDQCLRYAPSEIAYWAGRAEDSRFLWKEAEIRLKQDEAKFYLKTKAANPELKIEDLKRLVDESDEIYKQRLNAISHESAYKKDVIKVDRWINAFASARKSANLKVEEMRSLHTTVRGGR